MSDTKQIDYVTPLKTTEPTITLEIDGSTLTVPEGTSIMAVESSLCSLGKMK